MRRWMPIEEFLARRAKEEDEHAEQLDRVREVDRFGGTRVAVPAEPGVRGTPAVNRKD